MSDQFNMFDAANTYEALEGAEKIAEEGGTVLNIAYSPDRRVSVFYKIPDASVQEKIVSRLFEPSRYSR